MKNNFCNSKQLLPVEKSDTFDVLSSFYNIKWLQKKIIITDLCEIRVSFKYKSIKHCDTVQYHYM